MVETQEDQEVWCYIPEFPRYQISNHGRIYNSRTDQIMRSSINNHGHLKINLVDEETGERLTRSVAKFVADAFVHKPNEACDHVMALDGDRENCHADNLVWRPAWYAWKYVRQLKMPQPVYFRNLEVENIVADYCYSSVMMAGMAEGLLFVDIWRSTYTREPLFPTGAIFQVVERV